VRRFFEGEALVARADLLINLVRANSRGDSPLFRRTLEALIAEERAKQHHVFANRLAEYLNGSGSLDLLNKSDTRSPALVDDKLKNLFTEVVPHRKLEDLILPELAFVAVRDLLEEHFRKDLLRAHNLEPRHRILLIGPPGNGKTSLAEAIAEGLMLPLIVVRYEGVIGSYLGETAVRLRRLFDYARTRACVLFFDEFDTLGKERGDVHETGEIKRVVSSLLLQIDDLPSHVIVVTATNHPELLDRAVWRRFQLRLELPAPQLSQIAAWMKRFEDRLGELLWSTPETIASHLEGLSFAELEEFTNDILRRRVLEGSDADLKKLASRLMKQWAGRVTRVPAGS
jgi:AAA+ superfamily predicted ATPase